MYKVTLTKALMFVGVAQGALLFASYVLWRGARLLSVVQLRMLFGRPHPFLAADRDERRRQDFLYLPREVLCFSFHMKGDRGEQEGRIAKAAPFGDLSLFKPPNYSN